MATRARIPRIDDPIPLSAAEPDSDTHGLPPVRFAVLPHEDPEGYAALLDALVAEHRPATPTETFLVTEMAQAQWKLMRFDGIEAHVLSMGANSNPSEALAGAFLQNQDLFLALDRYANSIRRAWREALDRLMKLRAAQAREESRAARTRRDRAITAIDEFLAAPVAAPAPAPAPERKSKPMPAHLERELGAHRRRDPLFDPDRDASQMSRQLRNWFAKTS